MVPGFLLEVIIYIISQREPAIDDIYRAYTCPGI
jgi:hypothetical protein